jgi:hypothetical protein
MQGPSFLALQPWRLPKKKLEKNIGKSPEGCAQKGGALNGENVNETIRVREF